MPQSLSPVVQAFRGNPFDATERVRRAGEQALRKLDVSAALQELVAAGQLEDAKDLLLAVAHYQACADPDHPERILGRDTVQPSVWAALPRRREAYVRVAAAAGRCFAALSQIRGTSDGMQRARREAWAACFGDSLRHALNLERVIRDHDVLVLGETGTGKEAFAHALQAATPGDDRGGPAASAEVNAAAIPDTLVESELFGHVKGAFTGAQDTRTGRLRVADGGSFFLDEVGDLPLTTQVKLLRVIETNRVYPLGSDTAHTVDVRYIAATHKDLDALVAAKEFRQDLYQRLAGNIIRIPPLRERPDDIVEIGRHFVTAYLAQTGAKLDTRVIEDWLVSKEARGYPWPGNVRELQNALRNLILGLAPGLAPPVRPPVPDLPPAVRDCTATMAEVSDWYLARVLAHTGNNLTRTATILAIDRSTVRRRAKTP